MTADRGTGAGGSERKRGSPKGVGACADPPAPFPCLKRAAARERARSGHLVAVPCLTRAAARERARSGHLVAVPCLTRAAARETMTKRHDEAGSSPWASGIRLGLMGLCPRYSSIAVVILGTGLTAAWLLRSDRAALRGPLAPTLEGPVELGREPTDDAESRPTAFQQVRPRTAPEQEAPNPEPSSRSDPSELTARDKRLALDLARMIERDFQEVAALLTTPERIGELRKEVPALRRDADAARSKLSELGRPFLEAKFKAGEAEPVSEVPRSNPDELMLCLSGADSLKVVRLARSEQPSLEEAWTKRDEDLGRIRSRAWALIASWSR